MMVGTTAKGLIDMFGWCHGQAGWGGWIAMTVSMVALAASAILAGALVWRASRAGRQEEAQDQEPQTLLAERFARGEIDEREYLERRDALTP